MLKPLVDSTIEVYVRIAADLLPTPAKAHYTFNLRDVSKVFQVCVGGGSGSYFQRPPRCTTPSISGVSPISFRCVWGEKRGALGTVSRRFSGSTESPQ